jgi:CubicO group peptidase (beta-lactamase class C family)
MSKTFTATAAMFAAQQGLVDLDAPITRYLSDFTVNSRFEENPQEKMTLRILLAHRAGFPHEAPVGNNHDVANISFAEHVASISETWLKFPVGQQYGYSNLGIDLAGHILEVVSSRSLAQYMTDTLFVPLGMGRSSIDMVSIKADTDRAIGHTRHFARLPVDVPMVAAGGVYTSAEDLAEFVRFHLNLGTRDGTQLLDERFLRQMYTMPDPNVPYALGIGVDKQPDCTYLYHGGGGFGFLTSMIWCPEYGIGAIELTNSTAHNIQGRLSRAILSEIIATGAVAEQPVAQPIAEIVERPNASDQMNVAFVPTPYEQTWQRYLGSYRFVFKGFKLTRFGQFVRDHDRQGQLRIHKQGDYLCLNGEPLAEHLPGLFFRPDGDSLDFRSDVPRLGSLELEKMD